MKLKLLFAAVIGALLLSAQVSYAAVALLTGPLDPGNTLGTLNSLINSINAAAFVTNGTGTLNQALNLVSTTNAVNALQITPSATGNPVLVNVGPSSGQVVDANAPLILAGIGTGGTYIGGSSLASAGLQVISPASSVNQLIVTSTITAGLPTLTVGGTGSDANPSFAVATKGTGTLLLGGITTTLAGLQIAQTASRVNDVVLTPGATGSIPTFVSGGAGADANIGFAVAASGTGALWLGGSTSSLASVQIAQTASRVNDILITPGATGNVPIIASGGAGSDANLGVELVGTGTGTVLLGGTATTAGLQVKQVASAVNDVVVTPTITGSVPTIALGGASVDANRNLGVAGSGTGLVILGQTICTASGATPQTCNGQRGIVTTNSLSTAAATDASFVINNTSVSSSSLVECTDEAYSGTLVTNGYPVIMTCVPGSTTITVHITNLHAANALAGTVQIGFVVLN